VNNSLWDLYHLLRYFLKQDAALAKAGVLSVRERFVEAMRVDPYNLNPDLLYPVIDSTTVKRTRQFVKKHYSADTIKGPDGALVPIVGEVQAGELSEVGLSDSGRTGSGRTHPLRTSQALRVIDICLLQNPEEDGAGTRDFS